MKKIILSSLFLFFFLNFSWSQNIAKDNTQIKPLTAGQKAPLSGEIQKGNGEKMLFADIIKEKQTLVIFYRGGWCPFCNRHLANLQDIVDSLTAKGVQIIAISPDAQNEIQNTIEKKELSYQVFSDFSTQIMSNFGVAFYEKNERVLPVPSVFLINEKGKITFSHADPNYTKRLSNEKILKIIK